MKRRAWLILLAAGVLIITGAAFFMGMRWKIDWEAANFVESDKFLANRERGFYNMRGIRISDDSPVSGEILEEIMREQPEETLELLQIHIGTYRDREISSSGVDQIRRIFRAYAEKEKPVSLIVRFLYDWDGNGAQSDPASISIVLRHMEQTGEILGDFQDQIYIVQGVFVGSWAEMHSSRYLTEKSYLTLIDKMHETMPENVFLAVRTPAYWRMAAGRKEPLQESEAWKMQEMISRLSLFNDGMLGNALDCGTYGEIRKADSESLSDSWVRSEELDFQKELNLYVPNGGEVVLDNALNDLENADEALRTMHVSYLNRAHDMQVLEKWKNTQYRDSGSVYDGMSGYDYIERHLGYRFVIRDVSAKISGWKWEKPSLTVNVENVGYAPRYTACRTEIIFRSRESGEERTVTADTDARTWKPGEQTSFTVELPELPAGAYDVYMKVTGEKDRTAVLFANEKITAEDGGCFLGTIKKGE
ncbi:MAG TPA: DUF4832 domain-containing protein [Candidatus Mediterraneibacter cottocaccae]|nr:DUF4832 domain-containing protein [Candidatus Mediterraneibacter cottocaccae]